MKMLKRVVSCAMAAVMSLAMLTACSGSSGGGSKTGEILYSESKLKTVVETMNNNKYTIESKKDDYTIIRSGDSIYMHGIYDGSPATFVSTGGSLYLTEMTYLDEETGKEYEILKENDSVAILASLIDEDLTAENMKKTFNFSGFISKDSVENIDKIVASNEGDYYTEKVTYKNEAGFEKFYYDGNTLKYFVDETGEKTPINLSTDVDTSKLTLSGKRLINTEKEAQAFILEWVLENDPSLAEGLYE